MVAVGRVAVQGGPADAKRLADGGGGLPVGLHPPGKRGLVGVKQDLRLHRFQAVLSSLR